MKEAVGGAGIAVAVDGGDDDGEDGCDWRLATAVDGVGDGYYERGGIRTAIVWDFFSLLNFVKDVQ